MNKHLKTRIGIAAAVGVVAAGGLAATADAGKPVERACLGEFLSAGAVEDGRLTGLQFSFFARSPLISNLGEGIHLLQAGESQVFPEACNS